MIDFEQTFLHWIRGAVAGGIPTTVRALSFNLYEPAGEPGVIFGIELIGSDRFDAVDPGWACEEVWEATPRGQLIPKTYSGDKWEECQQQMALLVRKVMMDPTVGGSLKSVEAVAVGFVDGDLEIL